MKNDLQYRFVDKQVKKIKASGQQSFEEIFHDLRIQVI